MDNDRCEDEEDARHAYEAPELTVLASVSEATLGSAEGNISDGAGFSFT
jgi:hypothetical protein